MSPEKGHVVCLHWCMVLPLLSNSEAHETPTTPVSIHIKKRTFRNSDMQFNSKKTILCQTEYQKLCTVYNGNTSNERYPSTIGRRHLLWSMQAMARSRVDDSPASQHWECALHTLIKSNGQKIRLRRPTPLLDQCSIRWTMCQLTIIPDSCHPTQLERSRDPNIPL